MIPLFFSGRAWSLIELLSVSLSNLLVGQFTYLTLWQPQLILLWRPLEIL